MHPGHLHFRAAVRQSSSREDSEPLPAFSHLSHRVGRVNPNSTEIEKSDFAHIFCDCLIKRCFDTCSCGEEDGTFAWMWNRKILRDSVQVRMDDARTTLFHPRFSGGTAIMPGNRVLVPNYQHFWEIKMDTPVYGTDMMIGIGLPTMNIRLFENSFVSALGRDDNSYGYSYLGHLHHGGLEKEFSGRWGVGTLIGVHLDLWHGTLSFYRNRHFAGIAFTNISRTGYLPMISSTAARSSMVLTRSISVDTTLEYLCVRALRKNIPLDQSLIHNKTLSKHLNDRVQYPPGLIKLLETKYCWLSEGSQPVRQRPAGPPLNMSVPWPVPEVQREMWKERRRKGAIRHERFTGVRCNPIARPIAQPS